MKHFFLTLFLSIGTCFANCVLESERSGYIEVPLIHDFNELKAKNPSAQNLYEDKLESSKEFKLLLNYNTLDKFDPKKETIFFLAGGPGPFRLMPLVYSAFPFISSKYNFVEIDHRGLGCSKKLFFQQIPHYAMYMRFAAADIEIVRKFLYKDSSMKVNLWGSSYGALLAQQYATMFPKNIGKVFIRDVAISAKDMNYYNNYERYVNLLSQMIYRHDPTQVDAFKSFSKSNKPELVELIKVMDPYLRRRDFRNNNFSKILDLYLNSDRNTQVAIIEQLQNNFDLDTHMGQFLNCLELNEIIDIPENVLVYNVSVYTCFGIQKNATPEPFDFSTSFSEQSGEFLIYNGGLDTITPAFSAEKIHQSIPNSTLVIEKNASHGELDNENYSCIASLLKSFFMGDWESEKEDILNSKCSNL